MIAVVTTAALSIPVMAARWLRVTQREHYIPGSCARVLWRWTTRRPPNRLLAACLMVAVAGAIVGDLVDAAGPAQGAAVIALGLGVLFPVPLPALGREPRLRATRRLVVLAGAALAVTTGAVAGSSLVLDDGAAFGLVAFGTPFVVDLAAALVRPIEAVIARRYRSAAIRKLEQIHPRVVAITGSFGKTSTKEHLRDILTGSFDVVASPASWNNDAGLSRTVNELVHPGTEVLIAEMGTYGPGEILAMCSWLRPELAVITAVGPVHLERMRTIEVVRDAKAEILDRARVAVIAVDDPLLADLAADVEARILVIRCATSPDSAGSSPADVVVGGRHEGAEVRYRGEPIGAVPTSGVHPTNVACAVGAAIGLGHSPEEIGRRLGHIRPPQHRAELQVAETGVVVIDDTYNSNPAGARAALARLVESVPSGRKVVVTPGMVELGDAQANANRDFGRAVVEAGASLVVVGWTNRAALLTGANGSNDVVLVRSRREAREWVRSNLLAGDGVLWENDLPDHYP